MARGVGLDPGARGGGARGNPARLPVVREERAAAVHGQACHADQGIKRAESGFVNTGAPGPESNCHCRSTAAITPGRSVPDRTSDFYSERPGSIPGAPANAEHIVQRRCVAGVRVHLRDYCHAQRALSSLVAPYPKAVETDYVALLDLGGHALRAVRHRLGEDDGRLSRRGIELHDIARVAALAVCAPLGLGGGDQPNNLLGRVARNTTGFRPRVPAALALIHALATHATGLGSLTRREIVQGLGLAAFAAGFRIHGMDIVLSYLVIKWVIGPPGVEPGSNNYKLSALPLCYGPW